MWQRYPYPPDSRSKGDFYGRELPPLPSQTPQRPERQYSVNKSFSLRSPNETIKITISNQIDVGFCKFSQAVLAAVEDGPGYLKGTTVFVKFYDPLFLNPDDLRTIPSSAGSSSSSSHESISGTTLTSSVELPRKDVNKPDVIGEVEPNLLRKLIYRMFHFGEQKIWKPPLEASL